LNQTVENWKQLGGQKDQQIKDLSTKLEKIMRDHASFEEQIAQKQREIALQVEEEKAALEARIQELELECDNARADADGMEKASTRLTRELVKVHEQYSGAAPAAAACTITSGAMTALAPASRNWARVAGADSMELKTGERLSIDVFRDGEAVELRAREGADGEELRVTVDTGLFKELDEADPYADLLSRTGVNVGSPRRLVVSTRLGEKEVELKPKGTRVLLSAYRYGAKHFVLIGTDLASQAMLNLTITEATLTPELEAKISASEGDAATFDALASSLKLSDSGNLLLDTGSD